MLLYMALNYYYSKLTTKNTFCNTVIFTYFIHVYWYIFEIKTAMVINYQVHAHEDDFECLTDEANPFLPTFLHVSVYFKRETNNVW